LEPEWISGVLFTPSLHSPGGIRQPADDLAIIREHIQQAKSAGVGGFISNRLGDLHLSLVRPASDSLLE